MFSGLGFCVQNLKAGASGLAFRLFRESFNLMANSAAGDCSSLN